MNITFDDARIESDGGVWLCLKVKDPAPARGFVLNKKKRLYIADIKEYRKKRSLDANAYFWALCDQLAAATGIPKSEVYKNAVVEIGGNSEQVCVQNGAVDKLRKIWESRGMGWTTQVMPSNKIPGCTVMTLYNGSSTFDTAQMSRLIDNIVQDCHAVGIETMTPLELARLKEEWNAPTD